MIPVVPSPISVHKGTDSIAPQYFFFFDPFAIFSPVVQLQNVLLPSSFAAASWHTKVLRYQVCFTTHHHQKGDT